ncbi:MAG TPA: UTRA domain-containing protein [Lichenihabitans sp.]|jgi:GntR family histidine utilization transcriptional repressor|nr:UTRA domain-containing protein [Lichenihabitans sp.]
MNSLVGAEAAPRYQQLKSYLSDQIGTGLLKPGDRLPSEQALVRRFSVSRMTANRAFNELEAEGIIVRVQGVGSFVATPKVESAALEIRDIAAEVRERGQTYRCKPLRIERSRHKGINLLLGLPAGGTHFRSCLLHHADDVAIQVEDRFVNPAFSPDYLDEDFTKITPYQALMSLASLQAAEHVFEATLPTAEQADWLNITPEEPCVSLRRRTWSRNMVASVAILTSPSSLYRYAGQFGTRPPGAERVPYL